MLRSLLLAGALAALTLPAAAQTVAPKPRYDAKAERLAGARPDPSTDEGGLWDLGDRLERDLQRSGSLMKDPALNAYVKDLACKLTGEHCKDLKVYILEQPVWNAFMAPNGAMAVYSGLMLRMDNEAELACVLGHEAGHFIQNHTLENFRRLKTTANMVMLLGVVAGAAGAPSGTGDLIALGALANLQNFNRDQESQADEIGFRRIGEAGLDQRACARIWGNLLAEFDASSLRAVRRRADGQTGIFDSHPGAAVRIKALQAMEQAANASGGDLGTDRYRAAIRPHLMDWLRADLRRRDFGGSLHFYDRRIAEGQDVGIYQFFRGELFRARRGAGDLALAKTAYEAAIAAADAPAEAWRELAFIAQRDGDKPRAADLLKTYLAKSPDAEDRLLLESDLKKLEGAQP